MKFIYLLAALFLFAGVAAAQAQSVKTVTGIVKDSTGLTVIGATLKLKAGKDSVLTATDVNGAFTFENVKSATFDITFSSIGFQSLRRHYVTAADAKPVNVGTIVLKSDSRMLKGALP